MYDEFVIIDSLLERPSMYLHEVQQKLRETTGTSLDEATICRFLKKNNFSRKKLSLVALQQNVSSRAQFLSDISVYEPEMLVFIDETGSDRRNSIRHFGYSLIGKPARSHSLLARGKRFSVIGILSMNGILDTYITPDNVNAEIFEDFIETSLLRHVMPFNGSNPHSVIILDNASIHHKDSVVKLLQSVGVLVHFLPPYCPDLNPIEEAFSKVKYHLKADEAAIQTVTDDELEDFILLAFLSITPHDCYQWIKHSGY